MRIAFHALGFHRGMQFLIRLDWFHVLIDERGCALRGGQRVARDVALAVVLGTWRQQHVLKHPAQFRGIPWLAQLGLPVQVVTNFRVLLGRERKPAKSGVCCNGS